MHQYQQTLEIWKTCNKDAKYQKYQSIKNISAPLMTELLQ